MEFSVNLLDLDDNARKAFVAFINVWSGGQPVPANDTVAQLKTMITPEPVSKAGLAQFGGHLASPLPTIDPELQALQQDGEAFDAQQVAVAAFGLPLPGPSAQDLGRPLSAVESAPALFGQHNAPAAPSSGVELDKSGLPWDARIHASSKTKTAKGLWTAKRNMDPGVVAIIQDELRALMAIPAPAVAPAPPPPVPNVPNVASSHLETAALSTTSGAVSSVAPAPIPAPPPPSQSATLVPPAPSAANDRQAFVGLIGRVSANVAGGKLKQDEVGAICAKHGVTALPLLANRLDLLPQVASEIDALIASRSV